MRNRHTSATPAGVPRSRSSWTRTQRRQIRINAAEVAAMQRAYEELYGDDGDPFFRDDRDDDYCDLCDGSGVLMACIDDICVGRGECFHGDGDIICPNCEGSGR